MSEGRRVGKKLSNIPVGGKTILIYLRRFYFYHSKCHIPGNPSVLGKLRQFGHPTWCQPQTPRCIVTILTLIPLAVGPIKAIHRYSLMTFNPTTEFKRKKRLLLSTCLRATGTTLAVENYKLPVFKQLKDK